MSRNIKLLLATLFILFILSEIILRIFFHVHPGEKYYAQYFTPKSPLIFKHGFDADSLGIMKIENLSARVISDRIQANHESGETFAIADTESSEVYDLVNHHIEFEGPGCKCPLKSYVTSPGFPSTDLDSAVQYYLTHPINETGFRSIPFRQYNKGKKKVLLLGDSFTWGHSASVMFCSFADNLLAKGYAVYNTGITCTDPVQYELVSEKYIPLLKPDVVVMNVYLNNDIQYYSRKPVPYYPQMLATNAGNLMTHFNGVTVTNSDSVYNIIADNSLIPTEDSWFNKFCSFTSSGTLLWRVLVNLKLVNPFSDKFVHIWQEGERIKITKPDVNMRVRKVQKLCDEHGAILLVCVIPYVNQFNVLTGTSAFSGLFDSIPYFLSPLKKDGYDNRLDGHFNDEGHKQYAEFLEQLIDSISKAERR